MNKACGYIRLSKLDQSHYSIDYQERMIREYCDRHKLQLQGVFTDNGQSSYTFDRPDYKALEKFIKANKDVQYLVFMDHSRFSRNVAEALIKLKELEDKMKVRVYATTDNFGTDFSDPTAFIMRTLQYVMGESELHNIRKRTRAGLLQGALSGRFMTRAPFGYKNTRDKDDRPTLAIVERQAKIIRWIFTEFLNGGQVTEIYREARKMGLTVRGKSAIPRIIANPVYCGLISIPVHKDRQARFVKGLHEAIIPEGEYWLAQERLSIKPAKIQRNAEVPLRGALRCWCGRKLTAGNSKSKTGTYHWYYLCMTHKENYPAKKLHAQFESILEHLSFGQERIQWLREKLTAEIHQRMATQGADLEGLERDRRAVALQIDKAEKKYLKGLVRDETFQEVITELRAEESKLQHAILQAEATGPVFLARLEIVLPALRNIKAAFHAMPLIKQHQFLDLVFGGTLHYRDGSYRTHFFHPAFSHNIPELKANRLLIVEKPIKKIGEEVPLGGFRDMDRTLESFMQLLELIA